MENKRGSKIDPWGTPRRRMWYSTWSSVVSQAAKTPSCLVSFLWNSLWMSENNGPITVGGGVAWGSVETDCNWLCMARTCRLASTGEQEMLKVWVEVNLSLYICCLWHRDEQHAECYTSLLLFALIQSPVSPFMLFLLSHCSFCSPYKVINFSKFLVTMYFLGNPLFMTLNHQQVKYFTCLWNISVSIRWFVQMFLLHRGFILVTTQLFLSAIIRSAFVTSFKFLAFAEV